MIPVRYLFGPLTALALVSILGPGDVTCFVLNRLPTRRTASRPSRGRILAASPLVEQKQWTWKDNNIFTEISYPPPRKESIIPFLKKDAIPPKVLLIHGFGCSTTYWRSTVEALTESGHEVHALDLLGQGRSSKPGDVYYSINLWANLVDDYVREEMSSVAESDKSWWGGGQDSNDDGVVLMGNSLGSTVALAAATGDFADENQPSFLSKPGRVKGICMFNCGVGLNSRGVADEPQWTPFERALIGFVITSLDVLLFNNPFVLNYVLDEVVTEELLRNALQNLYVVNPSRVDDALVKSFYNPAKEDGAAEALRQIYTNDPGLSPMQMHEKHADILNNGDRGVLPIHLVWGDEDLVTPLDGGVGVFYKGLAQDASSGVSLDIIRSGHIPFDDNPEESNESMLRWLSRQ